VTVCEKRKRKKGIHVFFISITYKHTEPDFCKKLSITSSLNLLCGLNFFLEFNQSTGLEVNAFVNETHSLTRFINQ